MGNVVRLAGDHVSSEVTFYAAVSVVTSAVEGWCLAALTGWLFTTARTHSSFYPSYRLQRMMRFCYCTVIMTSQNAVTPSWSSSASRARRLEKWAVAVLGAHDDDGRVPVGTWSAHLMQVPDGTSLPHSRPPTAPRAWRGRGGGGAWKGAWSPAWRHEPGRSVGASCRISYNLMSSRLLRFVASCRTERDWMYVV